MKASFFIEMAELWKTLTGNSRVNWFLLCQEKGVVLSEKEERAICVETKLESIEEIKDFMESNRDIPR